LLEEDMNTPEAVGKDCMIDKGGVIIIYAGIYACGPG